VVDEGGLGVEQPLAVEGPPEMPVGGVEDAHTGTLCGAADKPDRHTPIRPGSV
jgi:hypothetical protein